MQLRLDFTSIYMGNGSAWGGRLPCKQDIQEGSIPSFSTKCSFTDRGLEQVISFKQTPSSLSFGYGELSYIKGSVVVGFGPVLRETRRNFSAFLAI